MKISDYHVGFIGFGHMAQIIFKALETSKLIPRAQILFHRRNPDKAKENEQTFGITATSLGHLVDKSQILLLCVRPNQAQFVLEDLAKLKLEGHMILSIMAGIKISFIQKFFGSSAHVIRVMPNLASTVGEGMSLLSFGPQSTLELRSVANLLFSTLGQVVEIAEMQMDIGCGMAGSGPAFVIELIEAMARLGEKEGIAYAKSLKIAAQTFLGAAHLIRQGLMPQDLLQQIATPGGTTIAGLNALHVHEVGKRFQEAIRASASRSKEISEEFF